MLITVYLFGATIDHTCHILVHEFTHLSGHSNIMVNKIFAIFCNISLGIPAGISFGIYHADHHSYMGSLEKDPDLPTPF